MTTILSIQSIHKTFEAGTINENHVLRGMDLDVQEGILSPSSEEMEQGNPPL